MQVGTAMGVMSYDVIKTIKKINENGGKWKTFTRCNVCKGKGRKDGVDCPKCHSWGFTRQGG